MPSIIKPLMSVKDRTGWRLEEDQVERASVSSAHSLSLSVPRCHVTGSAPWLRADTC